jgi:hypothetical protein
MLVIMEQEGKGAAGSDSAGLVWAKVIDTDLSLYSARKI